MATNSLRQSLAYPLRFAANGGLELAQGDEVTQDRIRSILETRPREMIMRRSYGLSDQAFSAIPSPDVISERIRQAIEIQMGGEITAYVVSKLTAEEGLLELRVDWLRTGGSLLGSGLGDGAGLNSVSYSVVL